MLGGSIDVAVASQYTQGLNSALTSGVWNATQDQLAASGMTQAPGVAQYAYAQALAPQMQQNVGLGYQMAQAPLAYSQFEQQFGAQQAGLPLQYGLTEQQQAMQAGNYGLQYGLSSAGQGIGEAQFGLNYPLQVGAMLAGQFPNYQMATASA